MVAGLVRGLDHEDAARFSFLLATPIILAAGVYKVPDLAGHLGDGIRGQALVGAIFAGLAAYVSVRFLVRFFETRNLLPFAIYCLVVGAISHHPLRVTPLKTLRRLRRDRGPVRRRTLRTGGDPMDGGWAATEPSRVDPSRWPLVGRDDELALATAAVQEHGSVVLTGAAGVGKTRLAHEILVHVAGERDRTEWVAATHAAAAVPLGAVADLVPATALGRGRDRAVARHRRRATA